jgi:hypothetical protein
MEAREEGEAEGDALRELARIELEDPEDEGECAVCRDVEEM